MIYTFKDIDLADKQILTAGLQKIGGVGLARANYLSSLVGLAEGVRVSYINLYFFFVITFLLKQYYGTDVFLKRMRENRLKDFLAFKSYRAIRFMAGLPIRGQHTHTNAKTAKKLRLGGRNLKGL